MTAIATGVFKTVAAARQTALGTIAAVGTATLLRRTKSTLDLTKTTFKSAEILQSQQRRDFRHGVHSDAGTISGELSSGAYQPFMESICRQVAQTLVTTGAITTVAIAAATVLGQNGGTLTRSAGSFITDGFHLGDVVKTSGYATPADVANGRFLLLTGLSATVMTFITLDDAVVVTKVAGDSVTIIQAGKKTWIPPTGQVKHYYTIEHFFSDLPQSEVFVDCVVTQMQVKLPPTGIATIDFPIMGLNYQEGASQYFTTPAQPIAGGTMASINGFISLNNAAVAVITGCEFTVNGNYSVPGGVVGANVDPDVIPGVVDVTGTITALFTDATLVDLFLNETEFAMVVALFNSTGLNASPDFIRFRMGRVKTSGASKDDGEKAITLTIPFTALERISNLSGQTPSTFSVQDNNFA